MATSKRPKARPWATFTKARRPSQRRPKTTLMSILAGLYRPDAGQICVDGQPVVFHSPRDAIDHGVGMVYQHYRLVASQTVAENLLLGLPGVPFRLNARMVIRQARELSQRYHLHVDPSRPVWLLSVGE